MQHLLYLGLFLPLIGFVVLISTANWISRLLTGVIACGTVFLSFLCFSTLLFFFTHHAIEKESFTLFQWIHTGKINADFFLYLDSLSLLMTLIITGVGFLIHVYSNGYVEHEEDFARYFAFLNFFIFMMLLLVLAGNLFLLFVGWEGVGLASYLLIGYWYTRPAAAQAATKAFVVNRVGDCGFLIALLFTFYLFGTSDIQTVAQQAAAKFPVGAPLLTLITLLYFVGAVGKSAQLPLYTWLPDAMEGPTPVSALIHAATMVTAGVYLVSRLHDIFLLTPDSLYIVGAVGGVTALFAALCALGQTDLKRVLAYSTVSQLGLMFLACGVGAFYAAMFHLTTHAFMKSLLFLSAGNVVHMMHGTTDMAKMGGLAKEFPKTHWLFLIGALAMSGVPPLAAFFSKDLILEQEYLAGLNVLFTIALIASILTGFYLIRAYFLTFLGKSHLDAKVLKMVKEAPSIMLIPVTILAILSIIGGFLGFAFGKASVLETFLEESGVGLPYEEPTSRFFFTLETWMAIAGALIGVGSAAFLYSRFVDRLGPPLAFLTKSFYVNEIYDKVFVRPLEFVSRLIANRVEPNIFDNSIRIATQTTQGIARWLQRMQSGQIRSYVAWMAIGSILLIIYFVGMKHA